MLLSSTIIGNATGLIILNADLRTPSDNEPCPDFGRIVREIREQIDGRTLDVLGGLIGKSRSWLSRVERGEWPPEEITEEILKDFIEAVREHLEREGRYKDLEGQLLAASDQLLDAYDCHEDRALEKEEARIRILREQNKIRRENRRK